MDSNDSMNRIHSSMEADGNAGNNVIGLIDNHSRKSLGKTRDNSTQNYPSSDHGWKNISGKLVQIQHLQSF